MTISLATERSSQFEQNYPLNAWYAVAWDVEVGRALRPVTLANRPIVLYRTESGRAVALADACWHRLVPLSMGKLRGDDEIQCGYHGICFNAEGRATFMPAQETINPSASVHSYPVVERHRFVWVWPGDPATADPALVPDMHENDDPSWAGDGKTIMAACDYRLIVDNLMDLTHEQFVHGNSLAHEALSESEFELSRDETTVTVTKWMLNLDSAPPFWKHNLADKFPDYDGPIDRWQIIKFQAPGTVTIDVGVAKAGTGAQEGDRSQGVTGTVLNTMTPINDKQCLYLWAFARDWSLDKQSITTRLREGVAGVFFEDETMLEAQQRAIDANPGYDFYNLNVDGPGMWSRRLIRKMIDRESDSESGQRAMVNESPVRGTNASTAPVPNGAVADVEAEIHSRDEDPALDLAQRGL